MITVSDTYRTNADNKPLEYLIQISEDGGTIWQDIPTGAQIVDRPGDLTNEVEANMPFNFVGPDCELVCENISGYWTNDSKTGKLDTGSQVQLLIQSRPSGATDYIKHIQGPIDLSSLRKIDRPFISFIVRGTLNMLDEVQANYALGQTSMPPKFADFVTELIPQSGLVGGSLIFYPDGIYELKYISADKTIQWDGGVAASVLNNDPILLYGRDGTNAVTVKVNFQYSDYPEKDISAWVSVKAGAVVTPENFIDLPTLKMLVSNYIDLNIEGVQAIPVTAPDVAMIKINTEQVNPSGGGISQIIGVRANTFLISFYNAKTYLLTYTTEPHLKVTSFTLYSNSMCILNHYKGDHWIFLLCDSSGVAEIKNFITTPTSAWYIEQVAIETLYHQATLPGTGSIAWASFAGISKLGLPASVVEYLYAVMKTTGDNGAIYKITIAAGALVYTKIGSDFDITGPTMFPANISMFRYYTVANATIKGTVGKIDYYLRSVDLVAAVEYNKIIDIDKNYDINTVYHFGPAFLAAKTVRIWEGNNTPGVGNGMWRQTLCQILCLSKLWYDSNEESDYINITYNGPSEIHEINLVGYLTFTANITGSARDFFGGADSHINNQKDFMYCDVIHGPSLVGKQITFTSGDNIDESQTVSAQETIWGSGLSGTRICTKLTFAAPFSNNIKGQSTPPFSADSFVIYDVSWSLTDSNWVVKKIDTDETIEYIRNTDSPDTVTPFYTFMVSRNGIFNTDNYKRLADLKNLKPITAGDSDLAGDPNSICLGADGGLMICYLKSCNQYPEIYDADFGTKTLREAIEEIAISANCRIAASEHYQKISLLYKGMTPDVTFSLTPDDYVFDHNYQPFYNYKAVKVNDAQYGRIHNNKYDYILSLTCDLLPDCLSASVAKDILTHIGSGDRLHSIKTTWKVWLEPGDCGYLQTPDGGTTKVLVISANTDFTNRIHQLTVLEVA